MRAVVGGVDVVELDLVDTSRQTPAIGDVASVPSRPLPTTVYLPAGSDAVPLIFLAHGFNGHPSKFTVLARHWAEQGYVVAVPRFPVTHDEFPERDPDFHHARFADLGQQADDVAFVVAEVRAASAAGARGIGGRIEPGRLGLYGLSLGALTVWAAALHTQLNGGIDALVQSDGGFPGDIAELADVPFPVFVAHSDVDPLFPADQLLREYATLPAPKQLLILHGADHAAVGENTITPADDAYRVATTVFWDRYVGGVPGAAFPPSIVVDGVTSFYDGTNPDHSRQEVTRCDASG
jgi:dienelactone hydrolase